MLTAPVSKPSLFDALRHALEHTPGETASPQTALERMAWGNAEVSLGSKPLPARQLISSGCPELDGRLARGGLALGTLLESLGEGSGAGATTLALTAAHNALAGGGALVVVDARETFYPPAAVRGGIPPERMILIHPATQREALWACEQALRSPGVAAVLSWPEYVTPLAFRRLQLAAETGGGLGILVRSAQASREPSWADVRWLVSSAPSEVERRRFVINVLRGQNRMDGPLLLEADDEGALRMVPGLVDSAFAGSERRA